MYMYTVKNELLQQPNDVSVLGQLLSLLSSILTILLTCPNGDTLLCYSNKPFLTVYGQELMRSWYRLSQADLSSARVTRIRLTFCELELLELPLARSEDTKLKKMPIIHILTKSEYYGFLNTKYSQQKQRLESASFRVLESRSSSACVVSLYRQGQQHKVDLGSPLALGDVSPSRLPPQFCSHVFDLRKIQAE